MKPEDALERLLEHPWYPSTPQQESLTQSEEEEIIACLAAAERLSHLQQVEVPTQFASRLEHSLRAQIRAHRSQSLTQEHDLADTQELRVVSSRPLPSQQKPRRTASRRHLVVALLGVAALLVFAFLSLLTLATHPPPVARTASPVATARSSSSVPTVSAQAQLQTDLASLQTELTTLKTAVVNQQGDTAIQAALQAVVTRTQACQNDVTAIPPGPLRTPAQQNVTRALTEEKQTLRHLLSPLSWPLRLAFTLQLGALGDPVPTVTHVDVHQQSNGTMLIVITGTHIDARARLVLDGHVLGTMNQSNAQQFVASIPTSQWVPGTHKVGVLNPDGTAAQGRSKGEDDPGSSGTPTPDK